MWTSFQRLLYALDSISSHQRETNLLLRELIQIQGGRTAQIPRTVDAASGVGAATAPRPAPKTAKDVRVVSRASRASSSGPTPGTATPSELPLDQTHAWPPPSRP